MDDIQIPDQTGQLAVVTGASSGIGFETARRLAAAGAEVVMAVRDTARGRQAADRIRATTPGARLSVESLDLASLASVAAFAEMLAGQDRPLDLLVTNPDMMAIPNREVTADQFERQLGTNFLGPFALTGRLLPLLRQAGQARVVTLSSATAHFGKINFLDLQSERSYSPQRAYAQSRLAALLFALELDRRSRYGGWGIMSNAAYPGAVRPDLPTTGSGLSALALRFSMKVPGLWQDRGEGALPILYAATGSEARGGQLYGPRGGPLHLTGRPGRARLPRRAMVELDAARLWLIAQELTGTSIPAGTFTARPQRVL
jgi:NAD(P)-dependent dehydrogenase (short-subunit alcohol dehydrogenase family)